MKNKIKKYRFAYSGNKKFFFDFDTFYDLTKYLKKVPEWELKNSVVIKNKGGISYVGKYVRDKKMIVF